MGAQTSQCKKKPCERNGETTCGCGENLRSDSGRYMCKQEKGDGEGKRERKGDKVADQHRDKFDALKDRKQTGRVGAFSISRVRALPQAVVDSDFSLLDSFQHSLFFLTSYMCTSYSIFLKCPFNFGLVFLRQSIVSLHILGQIQTMTLLL